MFEKYSANSPSRRVRMTWKFAFSSPAHIIASFFGSGVLRPASGTWGTFAAWLVYMALRDFVSPVAWVCIIFVTFIIGTWATSISCKDLGVHDHSSVVIDEVFAIWMVQIAVPYGILWQIAAFIAFRFFDIVKIQPAKWFDESPRWQNALGVMLDDLVAAVYSIILLRFIIVFVS